MPRPCDLALVQQVLAADRRAFDQLYERLFPRVLAHARRRLGVGTTANAVAAASLEELFDTLPSYRGEISLEAFAFEIVRRRSGNALATSARPLAMARTGGFPGSRAALPRPQDGAG